jgi:hypothetical protein
MARPISAATLKKLLQIVSFDPSQFDVTETPEARVYTWKGAKDTPVTGSGWWGSITLSFVSTTGAGSGPFWITITFRAGVIFEVRYMLDGSGIETSAPPGSSPLFFTYDSYD